MRCRPGAKALFGDAFLLIPEFGLPAAQARAWASPPAEGTRRRAAEYLTSTAGIARPVQEWPAGAGPGPPGACAE